MLQIQNAVDAEWDRSQQQTSCIYHYVLELRLRNPRTPDRAQGRSVLSGAVASGQGRGWNVFWLHYVDTSGQKNQAIILSSFHYCSQHNFLNLSHLIAFSFLATNSFSPPDPYTKLLPGGCCSRNDVQAFDSAPDHWLKGCHFSFRSLSIPRQLFISKPQRHTFYHSHTRHVTSPIMPSHQLSYQGTRFFCKHKYLNSKTIVINKILQIIITLIILELIRCWCVLFSPCRP